MKRRLRLRILSVALFGALITFARALHGDYLLNRGTTFGMVGLSTRMSSGSLFDEGDEDDPEYRMIDPFFRAGYGILPGLAVGAEMRLLRTFPVEENFFRNVPNVPGFSFGPAATLSPKRLMQMVYPYLNATVGINYYMLPAEYQGVNRHGWDFGAAAGVVVVPSFLVGFGLEVAWHYDAVRWWRWDEEQHETVRAWYDGNTVSFGLRICGVKP